MCWPFLKDFPGTVNQDRCNTTSLVKRSICKAQINLVYAVSQCSYGLEVMLISSFMFYNILILTMPYEFCILVWFIFVVELLFFHLSLKQKSRTKLTVLSLREQITYCIQYSNSSQFPFSAICLLHFVTYCSLSFLHSMSWSPSTQCIWNIIIEITY